MPKWLTWILILIVICVAIWLACMQRRVTRLLGTTETVEVIRDSVGVYHVDSSDKTVRLRLIDRVAWTVRDPATKWYQLVASRISATV